MNIDPFFIQSPVEWTEHTALLLAKLSVTAPRLLEPSDWRNWGWVLMQAPQLQKYHIPDPGRFQEWRAWADRFNQAVPL